ncbi:MAG: membrane integrity-associated transporter subunit PqiC [Candidatus Aminicenantes bacterium]|nr:membrane integrity-associated transporter subunit PqiC [Candidatus Aminicenantes bacterium]
MRKKYLFIILLSIYVVGCISSSRKQYFQLHMEVSGREAKLHEAEPEWDKTIRIEPVAVEDIYNDYRIVYRTSPYRLNYYSYSFWIKKPGKVVRDALYDYFVKTNIFKKVTFEFVEGDPDYTLSARVNILEEYDLKHVWFAHLKMVIEIKDFKSGETLVFHRFDSRRRLLERKVERVPAAISKILKDELAKVVEQFRAKVK